VEKQIEMVEVLKALADDTRYKIFKMLLHSELCACTILDEFAITQPTLSHHMKKLTNSGLITCRKDGIWMRYSVNRAVFDAMKLEFQRLDTVSETETVCFCEKK